MAGAERSDNIVYRRFEGFRIRTIDDALAVGSRVARPINPSELRVEVELCDLVAGLIVDPCAIARLVVLREIFRLPSPITEKPAQ
jgi:hypothetical protein